MGKGFPGQRNRRRPVQVCARDTRALQQLALNVHVKNSNLMEKEHFIIFVLLFIYSYMTSNIRVTLFD